MRSRRGFVEKPPRGGDMPQEPPSRGITISTAGVPVLFRCDDPVLLEALHEFYKGYLSDEDAGIVIDTSVCTSIDTTEVDRLWDVRGKPDWGQMWMKDDSLATVVDFDSGHGRLQLLDANASEAFGLFFRAFYTRLALINGMTFLHASGVEKDGAAFLFVGPSGMGKTTITGMLDGVRIIHDDVIFIETRDDEPYILTNPYFGNDTFFYREPRAFPIRHVYFLSQSDRGFFAPIKDSIALARLFTAPSEEIGPDRIDGIANYMNRAMACCKGLVTRATCRELHFSLHELPKDVTRGF